ncbi:MAG: RsmE family RNA methyltransferase [Bdellovibrionaceae bacterium]|nr:RsmE family RNA methyltransferase [Pseudobdellovibrionaceae bacterium]
MEIHGELFHHICEVCRLPEGAKFELLTTDQKAMLVILSKKNKKNAQIKVLNERTLAPLPRPYINLCLSLPKFNTLEAVLEKSVELGVYKVQPFFSDYSFVRTAEKISDSRFKRWQKIVMNASQQTGRSPLMEIGKPVKLVDLLKSYKESKDVSGIFPYEGQDNWICTKTSNQLKIKIAKKFGYLLVVKVGFQIKK